MTVLVLADDDSVVSKIPDARADLLISCGDLADETIQLAATRCHCRSVFAVKGNHDSSGIFPRPIVDLHLQIKEFEGLTFGGFAGSWRYKPKGNWLFEQNEVEALLANFPKVDVFVAHNSPRNVHDRDDDVHLGFAAFVNYMDRAKPRYLLHGHQHEHCESTVNITKVIGTYGFRFLVIPEQSPK